jgi:RNA polymerase sigma factor (sigma-70 family)
MTTVPMSRSSAERVALPVQSDAEVADVLREQRDTAQRSVRSVLGISTDEEDLVQEVMTRLVIRLRQPGEIIIGAWTWRVAHNLAVDHLRRRRATPTELPSLDRGVGEGLDTQLIGSELAEAISHGLARLPDRQRAALLAQAELDGGRGGHAIVAANLGVSPKAAESILARARRSLRRELDRVGVREGVWGAAAGVAVLRSLRRLTRPKAPIAGVVAIAMVSAITTSVLVWRVALPGHRPASPGPGIQSSVSGSSILVSARAEHSPAVTSTSAAPTSSGPVSPRTLPSLPPAPASASVSNLPTGSLPAITLRLPSTLTGEGVGLPPMTVPFPSKLTVPGVSVPAVTLPSVTVPGELSVPRSPPVTLPSVTVPGSTTPTVSVGTVPTLPPRILP